MCEGMLYLAAIGVWEWVAIGVVVLLLFGARKLPDLARSMGASVNEFKKGLKEGSENGVAGDPKRLTTTNKEE
ncbi:MAG: twin-arginine translocase TatA/TatE family subunit [Planctomycetota bacterium]